MKTLAFAAALMIGGTAVAQDAAMNSNPERDARGIPVVSNPAAAPAGANQAPPAPTGGKVVAAPNQEAVFASKPATSDYPACSRTVTDGCVQAYERGRSPS